MEEQFTPKKRYSAARAATSAVNRVFGNGFWNMAKHLVWSPTMHKSIREALKDGYKTGPLIQKPGAGKTTTTTTTTNPLQFNRHAAPPPQPNVNAAPPQPNVNAAPVQLNKQAEYKEARKEAMKQVFLEMRRLYGPANMPKGHSKMRVQYRPSKDGGFDLTHQSLGSNGWENARMADNSKFVNSVGALHKRLAEAAGASDRNIDYEIDRDGKIDFRIHKRQ